MTNETLDSSFIYRMFSNLYYTRELPDYTNTECSTTQAIQCLLKSFLERKLGRRMMEPKIVILSFGTIVHEALQDNLRKEGYATEVESSFELPNGLFWNHTDATNDFHSLEIKTITAMPTDILSHHYLQSNVGMMLNKKPLGYVSYIHKPSGICKVFPHKPDERQFQYVMLRATRFITHLKNNTLPQPEPSWLCQYCEYTEMCPAPKPQKRERGGF